MAKKQQHKKVKANNANQATYQAFIRYSNIVFFLVISALLVAASGLLLMMISAQTDSTDAGSQIINATFDTETIENINSLSADSSPGENQLPPGRINPFVE